MTKQDSAGPSALPGGVSDGPVEAAPEGETYTIGDLAREFGVTLRTLRFYEDRGLLRPQRVGSARLYGARERARLKVILRGKSLGFTLTEIRAMLAEGRTGAAPELALSREQVDQQIEHLEAQLADVHQALEHLRAARRRIDL